MYHHHHHHQHPHQQANGTSYPPQGTSAGDHHHSLGWPKPGKDVAAAAATWTPDNYS